MLKMKREQVLWRAVQEKLNSGIHLLEALEP